jgi:hypothetical protein
VRLICRVLIWLAFLGGTRDRPVEPMLRLAYTVVGALARARGHIDGQLWRRFGVTLFRPLPRERLLGRRE